MINRITPSKHKNLAINKKQIKKKAKEKEGRRRENSIQRGGYNQRLMACDDDDVCNDYVAFFLFCMTVL